MTRTPPAMGNSPIPQHVAIIMDGNGRWAQARGNLRPAGHREGVKAVRKIVSAARNLGIEVLTLFAFSPATWKRDREIVVSGRSVLVVSDLGGGRVLNKNKQK